MRKTTVTTMKRLILIAMTAWICGVGTSQAANMPQYQFYSTSMLSPNRQSNYAPSHINQSGSVKVQLSANRRVPLYQMGVKSGNYRVFSAEAFTKPATDNGGMVIVGNYVAGNSGTSTRSNGSSLNSSFSNGLSTLKIYTLATNSQSILNSTMVAESQQNGSTKAARVQRRTWMNIDEVERMEAMESLELDSFKTMRAITLLESMTSVQGILADEALATTDRRRAPGTPGSTGEQLPIGDGLGAMMLLIAGYAAIKRRKTSRLVN